MSKQPLISVVMGVHNGERYLREAVNSIIQQTYEHWEFIIIDDCSSDGTAGILKSYKDKRIRIIRNDENLGLTKSLNKGIELAKGDYIARLDADDISLPGRFEQQLKFMEADKELGATASFTYVINENSEVVGQSKQPTDSHALMLALKVNTAFGPHGSVLMRSEAVQKVGAYDPDFKRSQDYDLWLRLAQHFKLQVIPQLLYKWRSHSDSIGSKHSDEQANFVRLAQQKLLKQQGKSQVPGEPNLGIFILFLEKVEQTIECIESFLPSGVPIYILNNASSAASREKLGEFASEHSQIKIFDVDNNLGVGNGRNYLIEHTDCEWLFFVDNDITVKEDDWLQRLAWHIHWDNDIEVFIPKLFNVHDGSYDSYPMIKLKGNQVENGDTVYGLTNKFPGGASVMKRSVFERHGLYDEQMFVGFEDFELAIRAVKSGEPIDCRLIEDIELIHKHVFAKAQTDKKYIKMRYNTSFLEQSYQRLVEKHGVELYSDDSYKPWAQERINRLAGQSFAQKVRRKLFEARTPALMLRKAKTVGRVLIARPLAKIYNRSFKRIVNKLRKGNEVAKLLPLLPKGKKLILYAHPFYTIGGAEKVALDIGKVVDREQFNFAIIATETSDNAWKDKFQQNFDAVLDISHLGHELRSQVLAELVLQAKPEIFFICNSYHAYMALPTIKQHNAGQVVVDLIHATGGGIEHVSAPYIKLLDQRVAISHKLKTELGWMFYSNPELQEYKQRIKVIHIGLDTTEFKLEKRADKQLTIGYVGRLSEEKQPLLLPEILQHIVKAEPKAQLLVAGDGEFRSELEDKLAEYKLQDNCQLLGYLDPEEVKDVYRRSDVVILVSNREGTPLSIIEAMASGVPVAATNVGAIYEIINHTANGLLCENDDATAENIAQWVLELQKSTEFRKSLVAQAESQIETEFSIVEMGKKFNNLFKSLS
jgi:glycosyltransferase involved in cell wall biosynthesis